MDMPEKPDENDCCGSGCTPCIFDVYDNEIKRFNKNINHNKRSDKINILSQIKYTKFIVKFLEEIDDFRLITFEYTFDECESKKRDEYDLTYNPGQYFILKAPDQSKNHFTRPYTPLKTDKRIYFHRDKSVRQDFELSNACFQIVVKLYKDGLMSSYLKNLKIADSTMWRGPYGDYKYNSNASKHILMITQGTAIAPMYSIIDEILNNEDDDTKIKLFYCCKNISSIILRNELYSFLSNWNYSYCIFLSAPDGIGSSKYKEPIYEERLAVNHIQAYLSDKRNNTQILISGSEAFMNVFKDALLNCDLDEKCIYVF